MISLIDSGLFVQNVLQIFITQVASVFMSWVPVGSPVLLEEQVDICKRVLNIYRYMVMNSPMEQRTWQVNYIFFQEILNLTFFDF